MEENYNKVIQKFILPSFPEVKAYKVTKRDSWDWENFFVTYYVVNDITNTRGMDLWTETKNFFSMLNPKKNQGTEIMLVDENGKVRN